MSGEEETVLIDIGNIFPAAAATGEAKSEWGDAESALLLGKYAEYLPQVGPMKKFRSKRQLWEKISDDLMNEGFHKTSTQCENRYKTILKRKKKVDKHNCTSDNSPCSSAPFQEELDSIKSVDDTLEHAVIIGPGIASCSSSNSTLDEPVKKKKKRDIEILIELAEKRENNREKRHKEKMELLRMFLLQFPGNSNSGTGEFSGGSNLPKI